MKPIIKVENLSKMYRLGLVGTGTMRDDLKRWYYKVRGKEDPFLKVTEVNDRSVKSTGEYVWAIKDINFEVMPGEVLGIIGKNGAGKSTLLKILSRVTGPTTGRVDFDGRIGALLEVGTGFHPELTGKENIFLNGAILGMTKTEIKSKLDEIIDFSGIERYIDTPVKRYSSGMMVRLGFAVAAHLEPEILVVDEVLAVGDAEFQKKAIGKMQDVTKNDGRTVLFVSHNMEAVSRLCKRCILLENGTIAYNRDADDCIRRYFAVNERLVDEVPVSERKDRTGSGACRFVKVWFTDKQGNKVTNFKTGDAMNIHAIIELLIKDFDEKLFVTVAIRDSKGERIMGLASGLKNQKIRINKPTEVKWTVEKIQLAAEDYYGDLIMFLTPRGLDMVDYLENAFKLQINEGDFFGTGAIQAKGVDKIFVEFSVDSKEDIPL